MTQKLVLYTKDLCYYCHMLKEKLDEWGIEYTILNNHPLPNNHKTYPQLYYHDVDVQRGHSTDLTHDELMSRIERVEWPRIDSGID